MVSDNQTPLFPKNFPFQTPQPFSLLFIFIGGSYVSFSGQSDDSNNATLVPGGSFVLSVAAKNNQQIPAGVTLMKLVIRELDGVVVPCLDGISGSW